MTHVFIVNETTFNVHLKYMFAGTGSSNDAPFLIDASYRNPQKKEQGVTASAERNLAAMVADVSRIRIGDKILFYLQATASAPGMFFGIFEAVSRAFYQPNSDEYLTAQLGKTLNFRVLIRPYKVFRKGISEHEALDSLLTIRRPCDMCWSLIYRKLKGNRGCTMITDKEAERLFFLISEKNDNEYINGESFSFEHNQIVESECNEDYSGIRLSIDMLPRLIYKSQKTQNVNLIFKHILFKT